jgi:hypothetical protein
MVFNSKKMLERIIGSFRARSLDRLLDILFGSILPFFVQHPQKGNGSCGELEEGRCCYL